MICILLLSCMLAIGSTAGGSPTWSLTNSIKTGQKTLFTSARGAGTTTSYTVDYPSMFTPATVNPYVVYGVQRYRATDYLLQESFMLTLISQDFMGFIIQLQIMGITDPLLLAISFMAVDPAFPYFFNAYTEVPLNYNSVLSNFSTASASLQSHLEIVDYADQIANHPTQGPTSTYTSFSAPFSKYKIVLFLSSISVSTTTSPTTPLTFDITAAVLSATTYSMYATLGYNVTMPYIQFSQVFFDSSQFSVNSGTYLNFQELSVTNTATTTFFAFNSILQSNFMMGLKSFTAASGQCLLDYQWILTTASGNYGSQLQITTPYIVSTCGLSAHVSSILLMMKWSCPAGFPFFDLATQTCLATCNPYSYLNTTDSTCYPCVNTLCYTCNANNSNICLTCATNFQVVNNTCVCDTSTGAFHFINGQCYSCGNLQSNCIQCSYSGNTSLAYNSANFMCLSCNSTAGFFIDPNNNCVPCSVSRCTTCLGYSSCLTCNSGYGVTVSGTCSTCPIAGCQTCSNLTVCSVCSTGYNKIGGLCYTCPISCTCGGYTMPRYANGDCSTICGDGIVIFPYQACDDGNTNNGDGCSSTCQVEALSSCSGQPSVCYFTSTINAVLVDTLAYTSPCNIITLNFKIVPSLLLQANTNINWFTVIVSQNTSVLYTQISSTYNSGIISLTYAYNKNLQGSTLTFTVNPNNLLSTNYLRYTTTSITTITVMPSNNIPAVYMDAKSCSGVKSTEQLLQAQAGIGYLGLLLSLFSCKIIGLEMFGVLQLSYFSLSNYDYVPPALMGVLQRKEVNGLNIQTNSASDNNIPSRVTSNGYIASDYLSNINVMLLITAAIAAVGLVMYMVTYLLNTESSQPQQGQIQALKSHDSINTSRGVGQQQQDRSKFWHRISKYILKEVLLTFVIFNMFNMSYSAGIQIKYIQQVSSFSIICVLITFVIIIGITAAQLVTSKQQFGEYIDKFKKEGLQSRYMIATIIYRFSLGFLLAVINDWIASGIVFTFVSGAFLTYICYCEPFNDAFQNRRSKFVHSVHVLILFVNFYYRAESNANVAQSVQLPLPAYLQISTVAVTVIASTVLLAYQFAAKYILKKEDPNVSGQVTLKKKQRQQMTVQQFS